VQTFYQPLFTNFPLAILIQQFISLQQSSLQQFIFPQQFPFNQKPLQQRASHTLQRVFISSGKQGGGATVLGEGYGIGIGETCFKQLSKSS
jgi:hypothetical protein